MSCPSLPVHFDTPLSSLSSRAPPSGRPLGVPGRDEEHVQRVPELLVASRSRHTPETRTSGGGDWFSSILLEGRGERVKKTGRTIWLEQERPLTERCLFLTFFFSFLSGVLCLTGDSHE